MFSTEMQFIFPEATTLIVTLPHPLPAEYLGIPQNEETRMTGATALKYMQNSNIMGMMSRFDQSMLNLLIDRHEQLEEEERQLRKAHMQPHTENAGLYLIVKHRK